MVGTRRSFLTGLLGTAVLARAGQQDLVSVIKSPEGGVQPQAAVDASGVLHLVYLYGNPAAADIGYVRRESGSADFSKPVRVNSEPGSAIAVGTVRGARLAIGRSGRVHVAWNGSSNASPKAPGGSVPMFYSRLGTDGRTFEPQRNLMQSTSGLDGGGAIAADGSGNVYVFWHGQQVVDGKPASGEQNRRVYLAQSRNGGATFAPERAISPASTGACGCCGMAALATRSGEVFVMYRAAREIIHRDMNLLVSTDHGAAFRMIDLQPWNIGACPMSTSSLTDVNGRVFAAWETNKQVYFADVSRAGSAPVKPIGAPATGKDRKHPSIAVNRAGQVVLAWTDGTGWKRGGSLDWAVFRNGSAASPQDRPGGIPAWGSPAVVAQGGKFIIIC